MDIGIRRNKKTGITAIALLTAFVLAICSILPAGDVYGTDDNDPSVKAAAKKKPADIFKVNKSNYYIYVEKGSHTLSIYAKDHTGKYAYLVGRYPCATGRMPGLTPTGTFKLGTKKGWYNWGRAWTPYKTAFGGNYYIHGTFYSKKKYSSVQKGALKQLGTNATSGCVRTTAIASYFIHKYCPAGTTVKIVEGKPLNTKAKATSYNKERYSGSKYVKAVKKVELNKRNLKLYEGEKARLIATIRPAKAYVKGLKWSSSDPKVAEVDQKGNVSALASGTAVISVNTIQGSKKAKATVTVTGNDILTTEPAISDSNYMNGEDQIVTALASANGKFTSADLAIKSGSKTVKCGDKITSAKKKCKAKYKVESYKSCAYKGKDKFYISKNIEFATIPIKGEVVTSITLKTNKYKTNKSIKVGSSLKSVKKKYGKNYVKSGSYYKYYVNKKKLSTSPNIVFKIKKKKVVRIDISDMKNAG